MSFKQLYKDSIQAELQKQFQYSSSMQIPKITKVTLNIGLGVADKKDVEHALKDLEAIAGQKPVPTLAKKSIAGFKLRGGWVIGCKVTLRNDLMYVFLERLLCVALPKVRDFRGLKRGSFDGRGGYSFGLSEQIVFPEIDYDKVDKLRGLDICITTTATTDDEAYHLLKGFNFPFKESKHKA